MHAGLGFQFSNTIFPLFQTVNLAMIMLVDLVKVSYCIARSLSVSRLKKSMRHTLTKKLSYVTSFHFQFQTLLRI